MRTSGAVDDTVSGFWSRLSTPAPADCTATRLGNCAWCERKHVWLQHACLVEVAGRRVPHDGKRNVLWVGHDAVVCGAEGYACIEERSLPLGLVVPVCEIVWHRNDVHLRHTHCNRKRCPGGATLRLMHGL